MASRGLRVDDTLRLSRIEALSAEESVLTAKTEPIVAALRPKLKRADLLWKRKVCRSCRNGKKKRLSCTSCLGAGSAEQFLLKLGSGHQLKDILYNALKLPRRSRAGSETTDEEALQSLVALDKSGLVALALRYAKLATMREIYERIAPSADGCVRTVFNPAGTYTGRFSASGAFYIPNSTNLQNLPAAEAARDPLYRVRECFVPRNGKVFLYCVGGHTRILKSDLTWEIAERICVGDELIGFDENGRTRKFRRTIVTDNTPVVRPCVRVVTDKGTVTCSSEHLWLSKRGRKARAWVRADSLRGGDQLPWLGFPWDVECSYDAGWLAGLFDGEGHLCDTAIGFTQKEGKGVWERAIPLLQDRGFPLSIDRNSQGIPRANLRGLYANLRFLGQIRPKRLLQHNASIWESRKIWGSRSKPAVVLAVDTVEEQRVYPVTTTTKTFIAEGILTHNCDLSQAEARVVACLAEDDYLLQAWQDPNWDAHRWTASKIFNKPEAAITGAERYLGKRSRHALNYGLGVNKFWRYVNADADLTGVAITLKEAKVICEGYHKLHPNLDGVWWNRVQHTLESEQPLTNCFGRSCNFYPRFDPFTHQLDPESLRAAIAWEPQSTVSHLAKLGLLSLYESEKSNGHQVLFEGHDSCLLEVDQHRTRSAIRLAKQAFERQIIVNNRALTIPSEVFICKRNWQEMERVA